MSDDGESDGLLTDRQAEEFWRQLEAERADGLSLELDTAEDTVEYLSNDFSAPGRRSRPAP